MTREEIIKYNRMCAEFLGAELYIPKPWYYLPKYNEHYYFKNRYEPNRFTLKSMKFHADWNWIMEVVEVIEKLADWTLECLNYPDGSREYQMMIPLSATNIINKDKKEAVVQAINQFLIWNENNNT